VSLRSLRRRKPEHASVPPDEAALFAEVLAGSEQAWRRFVKKYEPALLESVRQSTDAIHPLTPTQLEDVMADFWLRLVENDRRWLRRFRGGGASLEAFLRMHALEVAQQHVRRLLDEPPMVPFDETRYVPVARTVHHPSVTPADPTGLASLLQLPIEVQALRVDVNNLRASLEQLRRALPPTLLSVADAAKALNVSTVTIRRMVRAGTLAHVRVGRSLRVDLTRTPVESINAEDGSRALARVLSR
jgi:excisionase family DNA binding protein